MIRVLVLGATGMLGHTLIRELARDLAVDVRGAARVPNVATLFPADLAGRITTGVDALDADGIRRLLHRVRPDAVVNCVGVVKQRPEVQDAVQTVSLNALFPHVLLRECDQVGARLIQVSTDCVFSGDRGNYQETDPADPTDLYGRSKLLGEATYGGALTLRTSIIGHELTSNRSLVDWFLTQSAVVRGYTKAIYSGVTTVEIAWLLRTVVLPRTDLAGLYHVAASPIPKFDLLRLIAAEYAWTGEIVPFDGFVCDRSLSADALAAATGYRPPGWPEMIARLREARLRWQLGTPAATGGYRGSS
ncbi:SDR family oxidoreductase [Micromonospora sp. WMMA1363]|uniref:dTDP-4-dehydrorhamnose reductase family protein n=1 Tax=Micromonospora sp. WMMA1363 TaxID=3053985 RepID=UPI00259CB833|nr:SDR family oxidoreductase [Micromonospora sp. WMMA1363]MDM4718316.1 SDR family oxidoreductase [Micromonospora sp. WMMA1363]